LNHHLFQELEHLPTLIVGDFNDWRNTLAHNLLGVQRFTQITTPISRFRSFPAYLTVGALDKAFVRGNVTVRNVRIVRNPIAKLASDHLPLVIDFHIDAAGPTP
jgi:endonuclease/exonuclease/phosphatase family metal-dependent hydrolase